MKIVLQSLTGAVAIHIIFFTGIFVTGYMKTFNHKPEFYTTWTNSEVLQSEVAFGYTVSPFFYVSTFLGTILLCGILLFSYQKVVLPLFKTDKL